MLKVQKFPGAAGLARRVSFYLLDQPNLDTGWESRRWCMWERGGAGERLQKQAPEEI